jgi:hypothetical protein
MSRYKDDPVYREAVRACTVKNYQKYKDLPEFKKRSKERFYKWLANPANKEKFKTHMRNYMRERSKRLYHERRAAGLCCRCAVPVIDYAECEECRAKRRKK